MRLLCISFIEFVRGVPLISVLFMASVVFPLFLVIGKLYRGPIFAALCVLFVPFLGWFAYCFNHWQHIT